MANEARPMFAVRKFYTNFIKKPDGSLAEDDWVEINPIGSAQYLVTPHRIKDLIPVPLEGKATNNPAIQMAHARWNFIKPLYEAWKSGQTITPDGTPLAAWNGISPSQSDIMRMNGVHTVEDLSKLTDAHVGRIRMPGLHNLIEGAKRFVLAADKNAVTVDLERKDAEIAELREQVAQMMEMIRNQPEAPRRGRPPKQHDEPTAA